MVYLECQGENPGLCRSYHLSRTIGCQLAETKLFDAKARLEIHTLFKRGLWPGSLKSTIKFVPRKIRLLKWLAPLKGIRVSFENTFWTCRLHIGCSVNTFWGWLDNFGSCIKVWRVSSNVGYKILLQRERTNIICEWSHCLLHLWFVQYSISST